MKAKYEAITILRSSSSHRAARSVSSSYRLTRHTIHYIFLNLRTPLLPILHFLSVTLVDLHKAINSSSL